MDRSVSRRLIRDSDRRVYRITNRINYGEVDSYITTPETTNDDVVYELAFLDAFAKNGRYVTSQQVGLEWIRQIQFGWSAEWIAIRNLNMGIFPPESGDF